MILKPLTFFRPSEDAKELPLCEGFEDSVSGPEEVR